MLFVTSWNMLKFKCDFDDLRVSKLSAGNERSKESYWFSRLKVGYMM